MNNVIPQDTFFDDNLVPDPMRSGSNSPVSIFAKMVLEHLRNASSTFSPVLALVSTKTKSFS